MSTASPRRSLLACGLAATLGLGACDGYIGSMGAPPPGNGAGAAGSGAGPGSGIGGAGVSTGSAGTTVLKPPVLDPLNPVDVNRVAIHRLNNLEYDNTVRDLVGVPGTAQATFQPDERGEFDNNADAFRMNDARYEKYYNAADAIGEAVFANAALKAKILTCTPTAGDTTCTSTIISSFGKRAWRRPLAAAEVTRLVKLATDAIALGETPEGSIKQVVKTLLASPQFLYRIEFDPDPSSLTAHQLDPYELATRLSYLGWSTMPDDAMFALAANNTIGTDITIAGQIDRMLGDPRGATFTESFAGQWLGARDLKSHQVEPTAFGTFDEPLRAAMIQEEVMYFNEFLNGTRPMTDFFKADVNFVNQRLAQHYGIAGVTGTTPMMKVVTSDTRVGFMGLAAFLTFTSFSYRTAPTLRGKWVLQNLLCQSIPPPPPTVPVLDTAAPGDATVQNQNVRVRLAMHRTATECAACHATLDPIGLGLENFDAIGAYRTKYANGDVIDSSGVLPTKEQFTTVAQLSEILSSGSYVTRLTDCASEKMMTYALSRALVQTDQGYLAQIRTQWAAQGYGLKPLLKDIALNDTFRFRHGEQ